MCAFKRNSPIPVVEGGSGATTLTGVLIGNGTSAVTGNSVTQHDVLVGGASNAITSVAPSATSGIPLVSGGASADPSFTTAVVAGGGTGVTSTTAYAVLCGGTSSTAALQSIASVGTSGQVLTSNGAGALPTFQAVASTASSSVIAAGANTATDSLFSTGIVTYSSINGVVVGTLTLANAQVPWPINGSFSNLYVNVVTNGNTSDGAFTLNIAGSPTSLAAVVTGSTTGIFSDTSHTVSVTAGQLVAFAADAATVANTRGNYSLVFTPS